MSIDRYFSIDMYQNIDILTILLCRLLFLQTFSPAINHSELLASYTYDQLFKTCDCGGFNSVQISGVLLVRLRSNIFIGYRNAGQRFEYQLKLYSVTKCDFTSSEVDYLV